MIAFPATLQVLVDGYSYSAMDNCVGKEIQGALYTRTKSFRRGNVPFNVNISTDAAGLTLFNSFYDSINQGSTAFTMELDSYNGTLATHTGIMNPDSLSIDFSSLPEVKIAFTFTAESNSRF